MCCPFLFPWKYLKLFYTGILSIKVSNEDVPMVPLTISPVTTSTLPSVS